MTPQDAAAILIQIIEYNYQQKPKPHHHNKDLMTTALMLEQAK
jgi:hypothetical protein